MMAAPEVVTFGEAMVLLLAEAGVPLEEAASFRRQVAGAESNVAIGLARLGHQVGWFGRVGADPFGRVVLGELRRNGLDLSRAVTDSDAATGLIVRDCPSGRPVEVAYYRAGSAGSRLAATDVDAEYVAGARLLHVTGITPVLSDSCTAATAAAIAAARAAGVTVSYDPNLRRRLGAPARLPLLREIAGSADLVLAGVDEAALLAGRVADRDSRSEVAGWFLDRGARWVVLKDGAAGCWGTDGRAAVDQPAFAAHPVDPVGAGDGFAAGFLSAHLRGADLADALRQGAAVAALAVAAAGDTPGLPSATTLAAVLRGDDDVAR